MQVPEQRAVLADRLLATPALAHELRFEFCEFLRRLCGVPIINNGVRIVGQQSFGYSALVGLEIRHEAPADVLAGERRDAAPTTRRSSNKMTAACRT